MNYKGPTLEEYNRKILKPMATRFLGSQAPELFGRALRNAAELSLNPPRKRVLVDGKCVELAEYFMQTTFAENDYVMDLAQLLQETIEDFLREIEGK